MFGIDGLPKDSHKYRINQDGEHLFDMMKLANWLTLCGNISFLNTIKMILTRQLIEYNGIKFKLVKSSRWHESYRYGEWKDEMWDKLLFKPSDEYIGNWETTINNDT